MTEVLLGWQPIDSVPWRKIAGNDCYYPDRPILVVDSTGYVQRTQSLMFRISDGLIGYFGGDVPPVMWTEIPESPIPVKAHCLKCKNTTIKHFTCDKPVCSWCGWYMKMGEKT